VPQAFGVAGSRRLQWARRGSILVDRLEHEEADREYLNISLAAA